MKTTKLYRPINLEELILIEESFWKRIPIRLGGWQPILYVVSNLEYAEEILTKWYIPSGIDGYIICCEVNSEFLSKYNVENADGKIHNEYWIPADDVDEFNNNLIGYIQVL